MASLGTGRPALKSMLAKLVTGVAVIFALVIEGKPIARAIPVFFILEQLVKVSMIFPSSFAFSRLFHLMNARDFFIFSKYLVCYNLEQLNEAQLHAHK